MQVEMTAKDLLWLNSFTSKDSTESRGFANINLTKIFDKHYLIASDGFVCVIKHIEPIETETFPLNLSVQFGKISLDKLKNYTDNTKITIDFSNKVWYGPDDCKYDCTPYVKCRMYFKNWLQGFTSNIKLDDTEVIEYCIDTKLLSKFCKDEKKVIIYPCDKRILLVKIPNELDTFGFIVRKPIQDEEVSNEFEDLMKHFIQTGV